MEVIPLEEESRPIVRRYRMNFAATGKDFFGIFVVNWLFTILSFGLYYPFARARTMHYLYGETSFEGSRLYFSGTGKEMFKGFIVAIAVIISLNLLFFLCSYNDFYWGLLLIYIAYTLLIPIAIHGSMRYRMSRTSWRGIRFGYRGNRKDLMLKFIAWGLLTIVTFGIYWSWMTMNIRSYVFEHTRIGNARFKFHGQGSDYFLINLVGYILTFLTLGIYYPWWRRNILTFYIENLSLHQDDKKMLMRFRGTGNELLPILLGNLLIIIFTLGFGYPYTIVREMNYIFKNLDMRGTLEFSNIQQSEANFRNAAGEDIGDMLDINIGF
jgi:uncharacterized membrane protein YjgN (DUF898 family)